MSEANKPESGLLDALKDFLEAQDALDNNEYQGMPADYFGLVRRRNCARDGLDAAVLKVTGEQP